MAQTNEENSFIQFFDSNKKQEKNKFAHFLESYINRIKKYTNEQVYLIPVNEQFPKQMNDLLFNSDGQCYINTNLKLLGLSIITKRRLIELSQSLEEQLSECNTNKCLTKVEKKLETFERTKLELENKFKEVQEKMEYEYLLCNDMIYENDIRICRREAKEKWLKELGYFVNNSVNLPQLKKNINLPNGN